MLKSSPRFSVLALLAGTLAGCALLDGPVAEDAPVTPPVGAQVFVGGALTLRAVTSDGWIVYSDNTTLTLHAAPISGGAPRDIVKLPT